MIKIDNRKMFKALLIATIIFSVLIMILIVGIKANENEFILNTTYNPATLISSEKRNENVINNTVQENVEENTKVISMAKELVNLNNCNWKYLNSTIGGNCTLDGNDNIYETFTITRNNNQIIRIVFNSNYKDEIVYKIKVGMSFDEVKDILGKPGFENKDIGMIGYVTDMTYLCIYENEIAVYPNKYYLNSDLENEFSKYYMNEFDGDKSDFFRYTQGSFEDFEFRITDDFKIIIFSVLRGIKMEVDTSINVILYKNYDNSGNIVQDMESNIEYSDKHYIEIIEEERVGK